MGRATEGEKQAEGKGEQEQTGDDKVGDLCPAHVAD